MEGNGRDSIVARLDSISHELNQLIDSTRKIIDDNNRDAIQENVLSQVKAKIPEIVALLNELKEIDTVTAERQSSDIGQRMNRFQIIDIEHKTSLLYHMITDQDIKKQGFSFKVDVFDKEFAEELYEKAKKDLQSDDKFRLLYLIDKKELSEEALRDKDFHPIPYERMMLIGRCHSHELAKEYADTEEFKQHIKEKGYNSLDYVFILSLLNDDPKKIKKFIKDNPDCSANKYLEDYIKEKSLYSRFIIKPGKCLIKKGEKLIAMHRGPTDRVISKISNYDDKDIKKYYCAHKDYMSTEQKVYMLRAMSNPSVFIDELIESGENYFVVSRFKTINSQTIKKFSEISIEDLEKEQDVEYYSVESEDGYHYDIYSRKEIIEMRKGFEELFGDIPKAEPGNAKSEYEVFKMVFSRMAKNIKYDYYSVTSLGEKNYALLERRSNMYGGLVDRHDVCSGKAKILKLALNEKGVKCDCNHGFLRSKALNNIIIKTYKLGTKEKEEKKLDYYAVEDIYRKEEDGFIRKRLTKKGGHAWNQVTIGGVTFNCDVTNFSNPEKALMSDDEFKICGGHYYRRMESKKMIRCPFSFRDTFPELVKGSGISLRQIKDVVEREKMQSIINTVS